MIVVAGRVRLWNGTPLPPSSPKAGGRAALWSSADRARCECGFRVIIELFFFFAATRTERRVDSEGEERHRPRLQESRVPLGRGVNLRGNAGGLLGARATRVSDEARRVRVVVVASDERRDLSSSRTESSLEARRVWD